MALKKPAPSTPREDPQQYVLKKNYKKAIEIYRALERENSKDANSILRLADCLVLDGQIPAAVQEYKRVAGLYAEQGFLLKAIGVNKKIVKLDPTQQDVHQKLRKLSEERGLLARPESPAPREEGEAGASPAGFHLDMEELEAGPELELGLPLSSAPAPAPSASEIDSIDGLGLDEHEPFAGDIPDVSDMPDISIDALGDALAEAHRTAAAVLVVEPAPDELDELDGLDLAPEGTADAPESLPRTPLFSDFTPDEFVEVVEEMSHQAFSRDAVIVREGDPGDALFVVVSGTVRVLTRARGAEIQLAVLKEGDFFGEGSVITGKPRTATIIASEEAELLCLSKAALDGIITRHPRVREVMMQFYMQRAESTVKSILRSAKK